MKFYDHQNMESNFAKLQLAAKAASESADGTIKVCQNGENCIVAAYRGFHSTANGDPTVRHSFVLDLEQETTGEIDWVDVSQVSSIVAARRK
jgi:PBP1b-binding outer membrane lipoprotein LpoB